MESPALQRDFWPTVMHAYQTLTSTNITLEKWTSFKRQTLAVGTQAKKHNRDCWTKNWCAAL